MQVLTDYMRSFFSTAIGFTRSDSGSDGREFESLSIIQRIPESYPVDEPYTSTSRFEPFASDPGRRRCWCGH